MSPKAVRPPTGPADRYRTFVGSGLGSALATRLGLPKPAALRRWTPGEAPVNGPALVAAIGGDSSKSTVADAISSYLVGREVEVVGSLPEDSTRLGAIVVDLSLAREVADLEHLRALLAPALKRLGRGGRVLLVATAPERLDDPAGAATQHAAQGIVRSIAKELRGGATANLLYLLDDDAALGSAVEFFVSGRSAYVDAQVVRVGSAPGDASEPGAVDPERPLDGKVAVVTGAARGIGASIVDVLARDGARVVAVDVPSAGEHLAGVANRVGGTALQVDVTAADAGRRIADHASRFGGIDLMVHNAGITRDKLLVNTDADRWGSVLEVNLAAQLRIDEVLLAPAGPLRDGGRVVSVSSLSGIAGNRGQVNYAASKSGVIGMVLAQAARLAPRGITYNAVAPGFIETEMTSRMPLGTRELGRRVNSLSQGGLPLDVAETIGWLGWPNSAGISGQVVRVCGQSLLGA